MFRPIAEANNGFAIRLGFAPDPGVNGQVAVAPQVLRSGSSIGCEVAPLAP